MRRWLKLGDSLKVLRNAGLAVGTVVDVGVQYDTFYLRTDFANVPHILFEPIEEYHQTIRDNYAGLDYELFGAAVGASSGTMIFEDLRADAETGVVSHVLNVDVETSGARRVPAVSLDAFMDEHPLQAPYLLKVDVDGSETDILRGAKRFLQSCSCLIIETTLPNLTERCMLAERAGLRLWDIVDFNFYHGNLYQVDLVFVHNDQVQRLPMLDPYEAIKRGFEPDAWHTD